MKNEDLKVGGGNPGTLQALQSSGAYPMHRLAAIVFSSHMKNEDLKVGGGNPGTLQALQSSCECLRLAGQGVCKCRLHARRRSACSESNWLRNRSAPGTWARSP